MNTLEQHMEALAVANLVRTERKEIKQGLRSGELLIGPLLREPPAAVETMELRKLLVALRGLGASKVDKMMLRVGLTPWKRVGDLTERQTEVLLRELAKPSREGGPRVVD